MADPRQIDQFEATWGLSLSVLERQMVSEALDAGTPPSQILVRLDAPREAIGQAIANESLGLEGGGFAPARGGAPMLGDITTGFFPARGGDPLLTPEDREAMRLGLPLPSEDPRKRFGGKSDPRFDNPDDEFKGGPTAEPGLTPFGLLMLTLDDRFGDNLAGVRELGDGTVEISLFDGGSGIFEFDETGQLFPLADDDPRNTRSGRGTGSFRPANQQIFGIDETTGRAIVFDPNTGNITLGEQIGFRGIDPEREFALDEAEGRRRGAETTRDIISNGRNFLTAGFLASRGQLPAGLPPSLSLTQADQLNALNAGATPAPGFTGGATASRDEIRAGLDEGTGSFRIDQGASPVPAEGPVTQDQLAELGRTLLPGRPKAILEGEKPAGFNLSNIALPTPDALDSLSKDEAGALDTQLQNDPNIQMTLDELEQQSTRAFRAPRRRTRARARIV
jgi:hypothetical protein